MVVITDTSCDSIKMQEIIRQILGVYEALIAYLTNSWNDKTTAETSEKLISLYKAYSCIVTFVQVNAFKCVR